MAPATNTPDFISPQVSLPGGPRSAGWEGSVSHLTTSLLPSELCRWVGTLLSQEAWQQGGGGRREIPEASAPHGRSTRSPEVPRALCKPSWASAWAQPTHHGPRPAPVHETLSAWEAP